MVIFLMPYASPLPPSFPHFSSRTWVIHISSLASTFPILFLPSPCLSTYHLCYLFPVPFLPLSPFHSPADNPPCDLHFCDSVPVLVVCLVCFYVVSLGLVVDSCEFVVILLFIFLLIFSDKVRLTEFIITKPLLHEMLKGLI